MELNVFPQHNFKTDRRLKMSTFFIFLLSLDMVFLFRDRALKAFYECFVTYLFRAIVSKSKCSTQLIVTKLLHITQHKLQARAAQCQVTGE